MNDEWKKWVSKDQKQMKPARPAIILLWEYLKVKWKALRQHLKQRW